MSDSLDQIAAEVNNCKACELYKNSIRKVFGEGSKNPRVIFCGEAPGAEEIAVGLPFVGQSGKMLREQWIPSLGLKKEDFAILNAVKCRPPENATPKPEEILVCQGFLKRQIAILNPEIIVVLGASALSAIAPNISEKISAVVGTFVDSVMFKQPVYVTFHPAWFLRNRNIDPLPYLKGLKDKLEGKDVAAKKDLCEVLVINQQTAENMAVHEMVSPVLSAIHAFCKKAGVTFKDKNQVDECLIENSYCKIIVRGAGQDIDFLINDDDIPLSKFDYWVIGYKEKGNYHFVGFVDRDILTVTPSRDHYGKGFLTKAVQPASFRPISELMPIAKQKEEEEKIDMQRFCPMHLHTEYSIGDGYGKLDTIGKILKNKGFRAAAVTDHGTLSGTIYFQKACLENGIKPVLGTEAYVVFDYTNESKMYHLVLLVKNKTGWQNLMALHDKACREGFYYKPRMLYKDVLERSEGLICMTACTSGLLSKHIIAGQTDKAMELASELKEKFGDDFYFEMLFNDKVPNQKEVNQALLKIAETLGIKCVITPDSHYPNKEDHVIHQAIKAISYNKTYEESGFSDTTFYYLQDKDIYELASRHPYVTKEKVTEMLERSNEIADKCNFTITQDWGNVLPEFPVPDELKEHFQGYCQHMGFEINNDSFLKYLAYKGFAAKGLDKKAGYGERLQMELQRFIEKGYSRYFLIVWDYVQFCKKNGIRVGPARGSVAASLAAYCMDITEVDPIKYDLLYDRFISPIRKDYPDIDLDFEDTRRDEVFGYLRNKYGINNCAQVITFSRWHGRGALRDVGRIFKIPFEDIDRITRLVIQRCISGESKILLSSGESIKIKELYELYKKRIYGKNGRNKRKTAKGISWDMKSERFKKHAIKRVYFAGKKQLYEITTCLGKKIKATEEHKFLTRNGWKRLKELTKQDEIMVFSKEIDYVQCKVCGEILKEVNSDHLEKHQMNKKHYIERFGTKDVCKEVSKKKGWQLGVPYYGKKLFGADNPMADAKVKRKWYKRIIEKDRRKKHSIWMKRNNPMYNKEIASKVMKNFCEVFRNGSKPQRLLLKFVKKNYDGKVKFDYYLRTKRSFRWLDVALVKEKIDFEFDGSFWHHNKRKEDAKRRKEIREMGWKVISIKDNNLNETVIRNKMEELKCLKK